MRTAYGIRDTKTNELTPQLFIAHHDAHAIRAFQEMATDERHPISRYLDDHELLALGAVKDENEFIGDSETTNMGWRVVITGKALRAAAEPAPAIDIKPMNFDAVQNSGPLRPAKEA